MSAREPIDPHVMALHYRVASNDAVIYKKTPRMVQQIEGFDVVMDDGAITIGLHEHHTDEASARAAVRNYLEEWEFQADLTIGAGNFRLEFVRAEIVERDPVHGDQHVPSWVTLATMRLPRFPAPVCHPSPPLEVTVNFGDELFAAMRQRYGMYSRDPETLTAVAYFCLTCLEKTVSAGQRRKAVAELYGIPFRDIDRVGKLTANKGGPQGARKAEAMENDLTEEETAFLADMVKLMIRRRGELAIKDSAEVDFDQG